MKQLIIIALTMLLIVEQSTAQVLKNLDKRIEKKVERAIDRKVDRHIDKTINNADKKTDEAIKKGKNGAVNGNSTSGSDGNSSSKKSNGGSLEESSVQEEGANSVNFKRGNQILFSDNFDKDALGDFPAKWNSTAGGEVKKLKGFDNKFLRIPATAIVSLEYTKELPENFTVEFDMILPADIKFRMAGIGFGVKAQAINYLLNPANAYHFAFHNIEGQPAFTGLRFGTKSVGNSTLKKDYVAPLNKVIKVAIMANGKRIRLYVDGKKMVDETSNFKPEFRKELYFNAITHGNKETLLNYFYISNFVLAATGQDERSQVLKDLLEKGSFSTSAILFATASDKLKPESDAIIKQVVDAMKQSPDLELNIVGHTDGDGDDAKNLTLSQKRAIAVKNKMVSLGISASRLETEGKGEGEPIDSNNSESGKAKNRRVEFIKLN